MPENGRGYNRIREGETYGYLTVLWIVDDRHWECECVCGKRFDVSRTALNKNSEKLHCGCRNIRANKYLVFPGAFVERWEVLGKSDRKNLSGKLRWWKCRCKCGAEKEVLHNDLRSGTSLSCGCLRADLLREERLIHGSSKTYTYISWLGMVRRCYVEGSTGYENYGGRGVIVCERWRDSFPNFLEDMGERPDGMTLDRKDVDGNYEKNNCRWATKKEQARNRRDNRILTLNGESKTQVEWSEELRIPYLRVSQRLSRGWNDEEALLTPLRGRRRKTDGRETVFEERSTEDSEGYNE